MATRIRIRRDSEADWLSSDPTLAVAELGLVTDTRELVVGDGATAFSALTRIPIVDLATQAELDGHTGAADPHGILPISTSELVDGAVTLAKLAFDPATQAELDAHGHDAAYVNAAGDTMTGLLTLSGDPSNALHAATKQYVDGAAGSGASLASDGQTITTLETTTSTSYTDLATVGPAATVTVGDSGVVIVHLSVDLWNDTAGGYAFASFATSGDATEAAGEDWNVYQRNDTGGGYPERQGITRRISGLTPGHVLTFTAKYRNSGGTANFRRRHIAAWTY